MRQFGHFVATAATAGLLAGFAASPARAGVLTFDFGTLAANPGGLCQRACVLPGAAGGQQFFTDQGVTIAALGYAGVTETTVAGMIRATATGGAYVTQKPGPLGAETGLGESNTAPDSSDPDYEVAAHRALVLDNSAALALGYTPVSVTLGSLQDGESADVFGGGGFQNETLLGALTGTSTPGSVLQTLALSGTDGFVTIAGLAGNVTVVSESFAPPPAKAVPEPATLALLGAGAIALLGAHRRSRRG